MHDHNQALPAVRTTMSGSADVRVVHQGGGCLRPLQEPLLGRLVAGQVRREELDGDLALQALVLGRVDDPHAACAELGADRKRAERGAWASDMVA